jgi:inorganic pyrophosphatase
MADDLSVAVERLRTSTQQLNTLSDSAAKVIREVEQFLEECHVGVSAWVEVKRIDVADESRCFSTVLLSYQRHKSGKFRIVLVTTPFDAHGPDAVIVCPWSECSRDDKIESLGKLPDLLVELSERVNEKTQMAEQALAAVGSLLRAVTKREAPRDGEAAIFSEFKVRR